MKSLVFVALLAVLSVTSAREVFLPKGCAAEKALRCGVDVEQLIRQCSAAAAGNPIAIIGCIRDVIHLDVCKDCVCEIAVNNGWTFLDDICGSGIFSTVKSMVDRVHALHEDACSSQNQCQVAFQTAAAACKATSTSPQDLVSCIGTKLAGTECQDCLCEIAEKNQWQSILDKFCSAALQFSFVQSETCTEETQQVCVSKINDTVAACKASVNNPLALLKCIETELNGTGCEECLCAISSEQGWEHITKFCNKANDWKTEKAPMEFGCGENLELECAEDIVLTFESCAKAISEDFVNPIADFRCIKNALKLSSNCCECVCHYIETHHPDWAFDNDECKKLEAEKICKE